MLSKKISKHNFYSFLWHAAFLALAKNFMDVDTIIPAMIVEAGGGALHIGLMTAIMLGGSSITQLFFAPYLSNKNYKKKYLLLGINIRVLALFGLAALLLFLQGDTGNYILGPMFLFITLFSLAGAFANISFTDILGKSVNPEKRKTFFSSNQIISGVLILGAAFLVKQVLTWKAFPVNYALMFLFGAVLLLIASGGFWSIKETVPSGLKVKNLKNFFALLKNELKNNKKLIYFLGFINTQGIAISFLPFIILYGKENFQTQSGDTGSFLLFKVIGIVIVSALVLLGAKKLRYNILLYGNVILSLSAAVLVSIISDAASLKYVFIIGGLVFSLYAISMNGLLLEISGNENRALYTGFAGAGNILPAVFPPIGGLIIELFGFQIFFGVYMIIVASAAFFIYKINCQK